MLSLCFYFPKDNIVATIFDRLYVGKQIDIILVQNRMAFEKFIY